MEDVYNLLMREIEPELMTVHLPELEMWYAGESAEERKARLLWYQAALVLCFERIEKLLDEWKEKLVALKRQALDIRKTSESAKDAKRLRDIGHSIDAA